MIDLPPPLPISPYVPGHVDIWTKANDTELTACTT